MKAGKGEHFVRLAQGFRRFALPENKPRAQKPHKRLLHITFGGFQLLEKLIRKVRAQFIRAVELMDKPAHRQCAEGRILCADTFHISRSGLILPG